jgi:F-type H+-transporting ATPase subunit a
MRGRNADAPDNYNDKRVFEEEKRMEHVISGETYSYLTIGGNQIPFITDVTVTLWVVSAIMVAAILILTSKLEVVPGRRQAAAETLVVFCRNFARDQIGEHGKRYVPYIGTLLMLLVLSNVIALFNFIPSGKFLSFIFNNPALESFRFSLHPPTRNFNVTLALALVSIVMVFFAEFKHKGGRGWLRGFYKPMPIVGFVKVLDYIVRPLSLCLRLFGNIMGAVIVMSLLYSFAVPLIFPAVISVYFDIFDGCLQAYVFVFLTSMYIGEAIES